MLADFPVDDANLTRLERLVEVACQAIYREREGYWPSDMERHHIAIALVAVTPKTQAASGRGDS